MIFDRNNLSR